MTTIANVVSMAPGEYGVEVEEGHEVTGHKIRLTGSFLDDLLLTEVDEERIVRETFEFLLERGTVDRVVRRTEIPRVLGSILSTLMMGRARSKAA